MTVSPLEEKIAEMQENAQDATQALQAAPQRVVELPALLERQTGALTALQPMQASPSNSKACKATSNGERHPK